MNFDKIAYNLGSLLSAQEVLRFAKLADNKPNVDSLWVPESWGREAFVSLGALSQVTTKVKLGTSILSIYARSPATTAMGATTLDMLSKNGIIIGLGASTPILVENWNCFKVKNFKLLYKPKRERIPIFIAAVNKHMISLACDLADGILLYLRPIEELKKTISQII